MGSSSKFSIGSPDSLNGLTFGQKIYFGDVGLGAPAFSAGGSSSVSSPAAAAGGGSCGAAAPGKKGRGMAQSGQPPRCQVEGCNADLSDAKAYYSRHKVCCMHSKFSMVVVGGIEQRFCQQCSRFHRLAEFDYGKRSCRRRLADHNERRRKPPPGSLLSSRLGQLSSSVFDGGSRAGGFLVNFTATSEASDGSSWPGTKPTMNHTNFTAWPGEPSHSPPETYQQSSAGGTNYHVGPTIPSGECFAGVTNSGCALSLLSNQHWSSGPRAPYIGPSDLHSPGHQSIVSPFPETSWGFKVGEASNGMPSDLGPCQVSQPPRFGDGGLDMAQPGGRQLMGFEHLRAYGSPSGHTNWSL